MITRFGSLWAGNVDMDNPGYQGTPANDRWLSDEELAGGAIEKAEQIAIAMDRLGYDTFWAAEHHFQREGYECIPNLLMLWVHLAHLTEKLRFGCGFNINPMWNPLRLAEDYATADWLTDGRVRFGVGRGYHTREVEVFGAPIMDQNANRELFEEQVEVMWKAFNRRSFSHHGKHYDIPPNVPYRGYDLEEITLVPRPKYEVEWWQPVVSASDRAINFMARWGIKGIIGGGAATGGASDEVIHRWQAIHAEHGKEWELGEGLAVGYSVQIANSEKEAMDQARLWMEERVKMFGPLGFIAGLTQEQLDALNAFGRPVPQGLKMPTIEESVAAGQYLVGPPDRITEQLMEIQERYPGLEEVNIGITNMGMPTSASMDQLEWFARDVMPHFNTKQGTDN